MQTIDKSDHFLWCKEGAALDDTEAQYQLATCYENGSGVAKNKSTAAHWYRKAADLDHEKSQLRLACLYENGIGVERDLELAFLYYEQAAINENCEAQFHLARFYENGLGVEKNLIKSKEWYYKSYTLGYLPSELKIRADNEDILATIQLGEFYLGFENGSLCLNQAFKCFQSAAEKLHPDGLYLLASCFENGCGVEKNLPKAIHYLREASHAGNNCAKLKLGNIYSTGEGVEKNLSEAARLYLEAANQGDAEAQCNIVYCFEIGEGVKKT
jgi:TPR repeat protein